MSHRLRRDQQHRKRGEREVAQGQRRTVHHHADEDDRRHDESALGCDLGAGEEQIERGGDQRGGRRPFLDCADIP